MADDSPLEKAKAAIEVLEKEVGGTLLDHLKEKGVDLSPAASVVAKIADGLSEAKTALRKAEKLIEQGKTGEEEEK